jgi:Flp pilus assembly protein CpaB
MFRSTPADPTAHPASAARPITSPLHSTRVKVRRAVLSKRRPLAAIAAALAVLTGVSAARPPAPRTEQVLVAAHDLSAGTTLAADDLLPVERLPDELPAGALQGAATTVAGQTLTGAMRAGEPLTDWRLVESLPADAVPAGQVLTSVRLADPAALVLLEAGRRIDLVAADPTGEVAATVVASDALVVAVPQADEAAVGVADGPVVVLAVSAATAVELADAAVRSVLSPVVGP